MDPTTSIRPSWFDRSPEDSTAPKIPFAGLSLTLLGLVALADWLFYERRPGLSITVYGCAALACLLAHRPRGDWSPARLGIVILVAGALVGSAIDFNVYNFAVLGMLMSAAMMDQSARDCGAREAVWPMAAAAATRSLGRWIRFVEMATRVAVPVSLRPALGRTVRIALPVLLVAGPILLLLSYGNALVGSQVEVALDGMERWLRTLHLPSPARILFWLTIATGALSYLYPYVDRGVARLCHEKWRAFADCDDRRLGLWRSVLVLAAMDGLLFWANSIDAVFLWVRRAAPAFHSFSEFLHEGTFALTTTTLFAAAVLVLLFQQGEEVTRRPWIRALAIGCVVQNLFLLSSVALRLKLYVDAYQLSVLRVHVVTFLVVVAAGYGLFAWRILSGKSLNWLVFSNAAAILAIFYGVQFVDVKGLVADYNTTRWLEGKTPHLDFVYLRTLGTAALPQYDRLEKEAAGTPEARWAGLELGSAESNWRDHRPDWRSWQWRTASIENRLFANGRTGR